MARVRRRSRDAPPTNFKPVTSEDFKPSAINRHVNSEAIQHPATILPAAGGAVAVGAGLVLVSPLAVAVGVGLLFVGGASYIWNRIGRGPQIAERYVQELKQQRAQASAYEAARLQEDLAHAGFAEGAKEARELREAYEKALRTLKEHFEEENFSAQRFRMLAEDAYREGMTILRQALGRYQALQGIDIKLLEKERKGWSKEIERLDADDAQASALQKQIDSHTRRIELYQQHETHLRALIAESNELESALETVSLQVFDLAGDKASAVFSTSGAGTRLERAVDAARRVEEKLRGGVENEISKNLEDELRAAARQARAQ